MTWYTRDSKEYTGSFQQEGKKVYFTRQDRCGRCGGAGGAQQWAYTGWTCYECGGSGKGPIRVIRLYTQEHLDKMNAAQDKRDARKAQKLAAGQAARQAEIEVRRATFMAEHGAYLDRVRDILSHDSWAMEVRNTILDKAFISDRQREALDRMMTEIERKAASQYIGEIGERREFTGELVTVYGFERVGFYAQRFLHILKTSEGLVKYVGSSYIGRKGSTVTIKAKIILHTDYKGEKQTVVERPKLISEVFAGDDANAVGNSDVNSDPNSSEPQMQAAA